jgi:uncharacterized protein (TIGR02145 family)/prepilin-type N-terminal cleavage/methylation domain-containing protein
MNVSIRNKSYGFTIVELLVVIVVIGILAAITIISYSGISRKAIAASLQSDLSGAANKLKMYQVEYGSYPQAMTSTDGNVTYCPSGSTPSDAKYCIKPTLGNEFVYSSPVSPYNGFIMDAINNVSTSKYRTTNISAPISAISTDTITIGTQVWMKYNLNVGTMINVTVSQTNNAITEKWCYDNDPNNCAIYGGLYQWDELMQYVTVAGPQGICPIDFHVPTDAEWKTLEKQLGMTQVEADATGWRGTDQGTQLYLGGTSGWDSLGTGYVYKQSNQFLNIGQTTVLATSTQSTTNDWTRSINPGFPVVYRDIYYKSAGHSVRCLHN